MSKVTLSNIANLADTTTAQTTINSNNATIMAAFDDTISRHGALPNAMVASLDMNLFQVLNLPAPATGLSPLRLQDLSTFVGGGIVTNIPPGGNTNQVLAKSSNVDFATNWVNAVTSVGLSLPADFTVSNSPVTTSGVLTAVYNNTPTGTGGFVRATSPTITSPTLTTPVISSIVNTGTLTLPTSTDTLVGKATTDVFTNKTFNTAATGNALLINGVNITANTGTGSNVLATSPTLITPVLGVASITSLAITGTAGAGFIEYPTEASAPSAPASGFRMYADSSGRKSWIRASDGFTRTWDAVLTANRIYTFQDSSDTIVGRATTDTFTNKTFNTAATGNSLLINGVSITANTGTGSNVLATSPTLVTPVLGVASATSLTLANGASNGLTLLAAAGTNGSIVMSSSGNIFYNLGSTTNGFFINDSNSNSIFTVSGGNITTAFIQSNSTLDSTSNSTGGLVSFGGLGVVKNIICGASVYTTNATFMNRSKITFTNNAAAATATLTNAPTAGNPTKWIGIDDNGTTRFIPAW